MLGVAYIHGRYETVPGGPGRLPRCRAQHHDDDQQPGRTHHQLPDPTGKLPLVQPPRDLGVPEQVVAAIEKPLKARVDAGYRRNDVQRPPRRRTGIRLPKPAPDSVIRVELAPGRRGGSLHATTPDGPVVAACCTLTACSAAPMSPARSVRNPGTGDRQDGAPSSAPPSGPSVHQVTIAELPGRPGEPVAL